MVEFPPLSLSVYWWAAFFLYLSESLSIPDAILHANSKLTSSKEFGRMNLYDGNGQPMVLSVPVIGGARQLRNSDKIPSVLLSDHGDWRKIHLGALESILGRKPFYRHIEPELKKVYQDTGLLSLSQFNSAIFKVCYSFLMQNMQPSDLSVFFRNRILMERGKEIAGQIHTETSVIQALASHGNESLLGILALNLI